MAPLLLPPPPATSVSGNGRLQVAEAKEVTPVKWSFSAGVCACVP